MSLVPFLHTTKKNKRWYVLYVKSKRETIIQDQINALDLDIIAYSPTHVVIKQWKDRRKKVNTPLLPKIVLVKSEERLRDKVFQIAGTVSYLFELRKPAIVREIEIEQLRAITDNSRVIDHEITSIIKGTEMDLTPYGFKGLLGRVDKISNSVCWVTLQTLGYTLKLTLK